MYSFAELVETPGMKIAIYAEIKDPFFLNDRRGIGGVYSKRDH
jgi:hypothetical protein